MTVNVIFTQEEAKLIEFLKGRLFMDSPEDLIRYLIRRAGISLKYQDRVAVTMGAQNEQLQP